MKSVEAKFQGARVQHIAVEHIRTETIDGLNYQWQVKQYGETAWANITGATAATYNSGTRIRIV